MAVMTKCSILALAVMALVVQTHAQSLSCPSQLAGMNSCAPFVLPGAGDVTPNSDCCSALQAVDHDCLCNTLRVTATLPSKCNLQPLTCNAG